MNDWIIFGLLMLVIIEIIFIILRIVDNDNNWIFHKIMSIIGAIIVGLIQLMILIDNQLIGEKLIFHWHRLIYELYIIIAIVTLFIINYLISKFINKFAKKRDEE